MTPPEWPGQNPLLSGLFGSFQQAIQSGLDTTATWAKVRLDAGQWAFQASGGGEQPSPDQLQAEGARILSESGVNAVNFGQYRGIANKWLTARQQLDAGDPADQLHAGQIFTPPWATTASGAVPDAYRLRVEWRITPAQGDVFTKWSSYQITAPLTSINDLLDQAAGKAQGDKYLYLLSGGLPPEVNDFEVEQI